MVGNLELTVQCVNSDLLDCWSPEGLYCERINLEKEYCEHNISGVTH